MAKVKISILAVLAILLLSCAILFGISTKPVNAAAETAVWDGTTITQPTSMKTINGVYYYDISIAEELAYIAQTGGEWLGYNYILANDIVLNNVELTYDEQGNLTVDASVLNQWTPINKFSGIFNGSGFSISGVYVNTTSSAGFFSSCNGDVLNLTIKNSYIKGGNYVGGICSSLSTGNMDNCNFYGVVIGNGTVGGLIGSSSAVYIKNSANYGNVLATGNDVGGICGSYGSFNIVNCINEGNIYSAGNYVGGITGGCVDIYNITKCVNKGNITGNKYVAGICPYGEYVGIESCGNTGNIIGTEYVGGLLGYNGNDTYDSYVSNGYNTGLISGTDYVGGIVGYATCCDMSKNYNVANVTATSNVGAIAGYSDSIWGRGTVKNCYYLKTNTVNINLNGFGNAEDFDGVVNAQDDSFFCINSDKTLNLSGHTYSANCDATCDNCGYERDVDHNYNNLKHDTESHWYECNCGEIDSNSVASHLGGAATEDNAEICVECGYIINPALKHTHSAKSEWEYNETHHWHSCTGCEGQQLDKSPHNDSDKNGKCDVCDTNVPEGIVGKPDNNSNVNNVLSGGSIAGIVIGSIVVVGVGGFSLVWFVIKKKSFGDFIAMFKKK